LLGAVDVNVTVFVPWPTGMIWSFDAAFQFVAAATLAWTSQLPTWRNETSLPLTEQAVEVVLKVIAPGESLVAATG
jgi:hypothetical protein